MTMIRKTSQPGPSAAVGLRQLLSAQEETIALPRLCLETLRLQLSIRQAIKDMPA